MLTVCSFVYYVLLLLLMSIRMYLRMCHYACIVTCLCLNWFYYLFKLFFILLKHNCLRVRYSIYLCVAICL